MLGCPLSSPISGGGRLACGIISVGHTKFLLKVEITRVQDPGSSPRCSRTLPTDTLIVRCRRKVAETKIIRIDFLVGKINVALISSHYEN